jgi:hypothetical protein
MKYSAFLILTLSGLALLTGCSSAKEQLGLTKQAPDEFAVVKRAPLEMPPNFNLRPPQPGAPRPQEASPYQAAKQSVFGQTQNTAVENTGGEAALLQQAGAIATDPNIRQTVDAETTQLKDINKPVAQKLLGIGGDPDAESASVVDPKAEAERLRKNKAEGKPVTTGKTPSIDQ